MLSYINIFFRLLLVTVCLSTVIQQAKAQKAMIPNTAYFFLEKLIATGKKNYPVNKQYKLKEQIMELQVRHKQLDCLTPLDISHISQPDNTVNFIDPKFFTGCLLGVNINIDNILQKPNNVKTTKKNLEFSNQLTAQFDNNSKIDLKKNYTQQLNNVKPYTNSLQDALGLLNDLIVWYERGKVTFQNYSEGLISFSTSQSKIEAEASLLITKVYLEELTVTKLADIK